MIANVIGKVVAFLWKLIWMAA